jgi:probable addiction module antidote protein
MEIKMSPLKTRPFDPAEYLESEDTIAAYLEAAAEGGDSAHFASALGDVARARNMSALARDSGLTREGLYKALSKDGNPTLDTTLKVLASLGFRMSIRPVAKAKPGVKRKRDAAR